MSTLGEIFPPMEKNKNSVAFFSGPETGSGETKLKGFKIRADGWYVYVPKSAHVLHLRVLRLVCACT